MQRKGNHKQDEKQPSEWKKTFANEASDKELISKVYKQLIQPNIKTNKPIKTMAQQKPTQHCNFSQLKNKFKKEKRNGQKT